MRKLNNKKIAPFLVILSLFLVSFIVAYLTMEKPEVQLGVGGGPGTINQLEQWKSDGTNITQSVSNKPIKITGLSTGDCLTLNGSSVLTTTTCGAGGSSTTTINGVSGPAFTFASGTATGIGLTISTSTGTITFTPTVSSGYVIPLSASTSEWTNFYNTPSSRITAGTGLTWNTNTLAVSTSSLGLGASFFQQNGNSFGTTATLGTNDANNLVFETNNSTRMTITSSGNVGIGTTSPVAKLSVSGGDIAMDQGVITNTQFPLYLQTNTANDIIFRTNTNQEKMRVTSSGKVGIGTTTPHSALAVTGTAYKQIELGVTGSPAYSFFNTDGTSSAIWDINRRTSDGAFVDTGRTHSRIIMSSTNGDGYIAFSSSDTNNTLASERMRIDGSGNVGIGTTTPGAKLHVNYGNTPATAVETLRLEVTGNVSIDRGPLLTFYAPAGSGNSTLVSSIGGLSSNGVVGQLTFSTAETASTLTERMRITSTGNVGIGTTSPASKLHVVASNSALTYAPAAQISAVFQRNGDNGISILATDSTQSFINFGDLASESVGRISYNHSNNSLGFVTNGSARVTVDSNGNVGIGTSSPISLVSIQSSGADILDLARSGVGNYRLTISSNDRFGIYDVGAASERLVIDTSGNVGIGTTSPTSKLSITQSAQTAAGGFRIATSDNADFRAMYMDSAGVFSFYGGDSAGTLNTATLNAAGEWTNASDRAYKERIEDLSYGLDVVMLLQPRSYVMRGTNQERIGFIAQEVELLLPELVSGEEGKKGISYGNMAAVIVKAIQDLYTFVLSQFKAQEQNNEEQEASIEALESRIRELEARQGISSPLEEAEEPDVDNSGVNTPIDLCLNLDGDQTEPPTGFVINEQSGECLEGEPTDEDAEPVDVTPVPILGCTDEEALNYDTAALEDDGSCDYEVAETTPEITAE